MTDDEAPHDDSCVDHTAMGQVLTAGTLGGMVGGDEEYLPEDDYSPLGWQNVNLDDVWATGPDLAYLSGLNDDFVAEILANYGNYFAAVRDFAETHWVGKQYVNPQDNRAIAIASRVMFFSNGAPTVTSIATHIARST